MGAMTEREARQLLNAIARCYRYNAVFRFSALDPNDDLNMTQGLEIYAKCNGYDIWASIAYDTLPRSYPTSPQTISIGRPFTCRHALKAILWCLERRDVGIWHEFGNDRQWIPLFKHGTTLDEMRVKLDFQG